MEAFEPELKTETAQAFMRQDAVLSTFSSFFKGESSGRLFVFYQEEVVEGVQTLSLWLYRLPSPKKKDPSS